MIIRRRYNRNFTVLPNAVVEDDRLSPEALGVLVYLRSRPEAWNVELSHLSERFRIGRDKTQRVVAELVDAGWIKRERTRDPVTRAFNGIDYVVYDEPNDTTDSASEVNSETEPQPENPVVAHPTPKYRPQPEKPRAAKPVVHIEEANTEREKISPIAPKGAVGGIDTDRDEEFEAFFARYAPPPTASKVTARRRWRKLSPDDRQKAMASIEPYRSACRSERPKARKMLDPSAYLSRRIFDNFSTGSVVRPPDSPAVAALRRTLSPGFSGGVLVEHGTGAWAAWQAVASEAGFPLRAIVYRAAPFAGRDREVTGRYLPSEWPPSRDGPDLLQRAAGDSA
ncbi:hypothetical protein J2X65_003166 [Ancylobacter sp. 3268]|uniref:helix-turn-helix domain-containing protein n=1 Tax=Ancylobacter sp. 3268 TaxID=2817752 RepID=UPI002860304C|nr:helix-turn-helix domain-containing protein [Ancylobacter sp. 3268]MDR6953803.1 hypothetical protein [Ancylobacter sp. 3268]